MTLTEKIEDNYANIAARFTKQVAVGKVETDPYLSGEKADHRRALTLLARPSVETTTALNALIAKLQPTLGPQYIHPSPDLHTTVLSVIPGTESYATQPDLIAACIESTERAIERAGREFAISYQGLIASSDSLIVKGYPKGDALQQLRKEIISELTARGIEQQLLRRYVMIAAHITVVRFVTQPPSLIELQKKLQIVNNQSLGTTMVNQLELAENDWYMRTHSLVEKGRYTLQRA